MAKALPDSTTLQVPHAAIHRFRLLYQGFSLRAPRVRRSLDGVLAVRILAVGGRGPIRSSPNPGQLTKKRANLNSWWKSRWHPTQHKLKLKDPHGSLKTGPKVLTIEGIYFSHNNMPETKVCVYTPFKTTTFRGGATCGRRLQLAGLWTEGRRIVERVVHTRRLGKGSFLTCSPTQNAKEGARTTKGEGLQKPALVLRESKPPNTRRCEEATSSHFCALLAFIWEPTPGGRFGSLQDRARAHASPRSRPPPYAPLNQPRKTTPHASATLLNPRELYKLGPSADLPSARKSVHTGLRAWLSEPARAHAS